MSEQAAENRRDIIDVLTDGQWHTVIFARRNSRFIQRGVPISLLASELPEDPFGQPIDHSHAQWYPVDGFVSETWEREGMDLLASGVAVNTGPEHRLSLLAVDKGTFIRLHVPE